MSTLLRIVDIVSKIVRNFDKFSVVENNIRAPANTRVTNLTHRVYREGVPELVIQQSTTLLGAEIFGTSELAISPTCTSLAERDCSRMATKR